MKSSPFIIGSSFIASLTIPLSASAASFIPGGSILNNIAHAFEVTLHGTSKIPNEDQRGSVSNVLKTRHDTVKNSIGNIR